MIEPLILSNLDTVYYLDIPINDNIIINTNHRLDEKIYAIKQIIKKKTYCDNTKLIKVTDIKNIKLFNDFLVYDSIWDKKTLDKIYNDLIYLDNTKDTFKVQYKKYPDKITIFFGELINENMYIVLKFLNKHYYNLYKYIKNLLLTIFSCNLVKINKKKFIKIIKNYINFFILKYDEETGVELHLDNIYKNKGGIIITVSIGPDEIFYDFVPVSKEIDKKSYRIPIKNGQIVVMDGISRYHYGHALPYNCKYNKIKFTIGFLIKPHEGFLEGKFYDYFYKHNLPNKSNINKCHF